MRYLFVTFVVFIVVGACFNPPRKEGLACGSGGACPPGETCGADHRCHSGGIDAPQPPDPKPPDAAIPPDAAPVGCQGDADCRQSSDVCSKQQGTCNLTLHTCVFAAVDCSSLDDDCNDGVCEPGIGCVKRLAHPDAACGVGTQCSGFGPCDYSSTCDSSATQSQSCSKFTCQTGVCTRMDYVETRGCSRYTNEVTCADSMVSGCGACSGSSEEGCAPDGSQTCTCTNWTCMDDMCLPTQSSCPQACAELRDGQVCHTDPGDCPNGSLHTCCEGGSCIQPCGCF